MGLNPQTRNTSYIRNLLVIKKSAAYRQVRTQLGPPYPPQPAECWIEDGYFYTVFDILQSGKNFTLAMVIFTVEVDTYQLCSARMIIPSSDLTTAKVIDLLGG